MPSDAKPSLTPKLRFPEFRDGPEWKMPPLEEVSEFVGERVPVSELDRKNYVSTENLLPDFGGFSLASSFPAAGTVVRYQKNDILAANIRPYLKKIWLADRNGGASNDVIVIRAKSVDYLYLSHVLKNDRFVSYVMSGAKGLKMPRGDVALIREYPVPKPSPPEQQKIAECLSTLDELMGAESQKLDALRAYKKGLMQQLFPREGETLPRLRFPEFQNAPEWEEKPLSRVVKSVKTGKLDANAMVEGGQYRFYTCAKNYYKIDKYAFEGEALLIAGNGAYLGYIHHYIGKFNAYQRTYVLQDFEIHVPYLKYFLDRNLPARIRLEKKDGNTPYIVLGTITDMALLIPQDEAEQQRVASCLSSLDDLIAAQSDRLEALKTHKQGLMQQLFPSPTEAEA